MTVVIEHLEAGAMRRALEADVVAGLRRPRRRCRRRGSTTRAVPGCSSRSPGRRDTTVRIPALDLTVAFSTGEHIRTEVSAKAAGRALEAELAAAGLRLQR